MRLGDLDHLLLKLDAELSDDARYIDIADQIREIIDNAPTVARTDRPLVIINEKVVYITEGHINAMVEYEKLKHMKELVEQFNQSLENLQGGEL